MRASVMSQSISRFFLQRWPRFCTRCTRLPHEGGGALVELAIVLSIFGVPLLLGTADLASLIYGSIEIANAAHAGVMYGIQSTSYAGLTAQIITVAQNEASDYGSNLIVTPTAYYACSASQASPTWTVLSTAQQNCTGANGHVLEFVKVVASAPVSLPFSCCGMTSPITLTNTSVMEVEGLP
jgi:Flp pilus assembly protein TadG